MLVDSQDLFYVSFCMLRGGPADPVEFAISLLSFLLFMFEMTLSMSTVTVLAIAFLGPDQAPGIRRTECKGLHMVSIENYE